MTTAETLGREIVAAAQKDDPSSVISLFFPKDPFLILKDIKDPGAYYDQLTSAYTSDIHHLHEQLLTYKGLKVTGFHRGGCKWKEIGTEYNKIPYWSCYRNTILAEAGKAKLKIDLRTMINWGSRWYVTHLGHGVKVSQ